MAGINYKMLFEVRVLHEYYCSNSDGTTIFDSTVNKNDFLLGRFVKGIDSINKSLLYEVPPIMQDFFNNYHLRLIPKYSGYAIFARVKKQQLPDGSIVFKPLVKLPGHANIPVQLSVKNNFLNAVTNTRINKAIPGVYYFTNEDIIAGKTFPVLSAGIPPFDPAYVYEQGELYMNAQKKICSFYLNGDTPDFLKVNGTGFASTKDELIVPLQFTYRFAETDIVTHALFELKDQADKTVRNYEFSSHSPLQKVTLRFSNEQSPGIDLPKDKINTLPFSMAAMEKVYVLKVTINKSKILAHQVIFFEGGDAFTACWAMVNIKPLVSNPEFNLYDTDECIRHRKLPDGTTIGAPVFEVRIKSRVNYWRYANERFNRLKADTSPLFLVREGNNLVSKVPRPASFLPMLFKDDTDNSLHYLPNPVSDERISIEGRKTYADIRVPESKMFPLDTS